ncbi:MAG: diguanylate cyclase domain-containing protein [Betaproteobacteria bacterium]
MSATSGAEHFRRPRGIRWWLVTLVAACLLPVATAAAVIIWTSFRDGREALVDHAQLSARAMSRTIDHLLGSATSGLQLLATSPALSSGDLAAFEEQARRALPYQDGNNIVLTDTDGRQRVNTLVPFGQALPMHGAPEFQRRVIRTGEPAVSDLFVGGALRRPLVAVEVPVWQDDRIAYTLAMGFLPERFATILSLHRPEQGWIVSIFDRQGTIVARTHESERFVGQKGASDLLAALAKSPEGAIEVNTLEGVPVYAVFTKSTQTGWAVAVGVPRAVLLGRLHAWTAWLIVLLGVLLLFGVVLAHAISRRIAHSFSTLIEPATALGEGRPVAIPPLAIAEAAELGNAIGRASDLLHTRTTERDHAHEVATTMQERAQQMTHAAQHDPLTELPNRARFTDVLVDKLRACEESKGHLTVMFVDIDDFKPVNDLHGHLVGDTLLCAFAKRLRSSVRERDLVARIGGDEFAVLIDGHSPDELSVLASDMLERLSRPYVIEGLQIRVSASIGAAGFPHHGKSVEMLLRAADVAMYESKREGKGRFSTSGPMPLKAA